MIWPINPHIHPPAHQTTHPPMGGGVSTASKFSNRIEISQFIQILFNFYRFRGVPLLVDGWVGGWEWPPCMCTHIHTHAHTCVWHHRESPKSYGSSHLHEIIMFIMHVCACMCECAWGLPPPTHTPIHPINHPPTPRRVTPKTVKFQYVLN